MLKILVRVAIGLLIILAVTVGIARSLFPYIDQYRPWFEEKISSMVEQPVKIQQVQASWQGLHPTIRFNQVDILDDTKQKKLIQVPKFEVSVNVLSSLIKRTLVPQSFHISGVRLSIYERDNRTLEINGIQTSITTEKHDGSAEEGVQQFFEWLLSQNGISLDQVDIDWHSRAGIFLPLTDVQLTLRRGFFEHQAIGLATLAQEVPAKFRFVITLKGDLLKRQLSTVSTYVYVKDLDVEPWMEKYTWQGIALTHGRLNELRVWADWKPGGFQDIQSLFNTQELDFYSTIDRQAFKIRNFSGNLAWQKNDHGSTFAINDLELNFNDHVWPLTQLGFKTNTHASKRTNILVLDKLDTTALNQVFALFPSIEKPFEEVATDIQPKGSFKNLLLRCDVPEDQKKPPVALAAPNTTPVEVGLCNKSDISLAMEISDLQILPWKNLPGITGLSGYLKIAPSSGELIFQGKKLGINFPRFFSAPFLFEQYAGNITWLKTEEGWQVRANNLNVQNDALSFLANMDLFLSEEEASPFVFVDAAFSLKKPEFLHKYVPDRIWPAGLVRWFNEAFVGPGTVNGQFLLHGPLSRFPFDQQEGRFELIAKTQGLSLNYRTGWPGITNLNADVLLNGRQLVIDTEQAEIFGVKAEKLYGDIPDLGASALLITGSVSADSAKGLAFISESPLQATLGKKLQALKLSGPMHLDLDLSIPLHVGNSPLNIDGDVKILSGSTLDIPDWKIHLDQLQGDFNFTQNSLTSEKITALWLGRPIAINIQTDHPSPDKSDIRVNSSGEIAVEEIEKMYAPGKLRNLLNGVLNYKILLQFSNQSGKSKTIFSVNSDLSGLNVKLPAPLGKKAGEKRPSNVSLIYGDAGNSLSIVGNYGNTNINATQQQKGWKIGIVNPNIVGWVVLPPANSKAAIVGEFSKFYIVSDGNDNEATSSVNPGDLPPLNILLGDFRYGPRMLGKLYVVTSPEKNGMRINRLALSSSFFAMNGNGFWQNVKGGKTQSTLSGSLHATNMGKVLQSWGVTRSLVGANGNITFAISWPGEIYRPKFSRMDGNLSFDFRNGRIINISASSEAEIGLGRMLNLLSLQSLPRRLSLDFNDFSEKGFAFDIMQGDFRLDDGNAVTQNAYLDGDIAKVELNGGINLNQKTYNLTMLVTPYVTSSLPVIATIAGGPIAGVAALVAHHVLGKVVNSISSTTYRVTGPWDSPNVDKAGSQKRR